MISSSSSSLPCSFHLPFHSSQIRIKTLCHKEISIKFPHPSSSLTSQSPSWPSLTIYQIKENILSSIPSCSLNPSDLMIISNGKKLDDEIQIPFPAATTTTPHVKSHAPLYVMIKPSTTSLINLKIKISSQTFHYSCPMNMNVLELKKMIYSTIMVDSKNKNNRGDSHDNGSCRVKITPLEQRAICCARLMRDHNLIGDYLLGSGSSSSHHGPTTSGSSELIIYITKTMNLKRDLIINLRLPNQKIIKFPFQYDDSLFYIRDILDKQFGLPIPDGDTSIDLGLYLESDQTLSGRLRLDHSLYDYGIFPPIKSVNLVMKNHQNSSTSPSGSAAPTGFVENLLQGIGLNTKNTQVNIKDGCIYVTIHDENSSTSSPTSSAPSTTPSVPSSSSSIKSKSKSSSSTKANSPSSSESNNKMFSGMKRGFLSAGPSRSCKMKTSDTSSLSSTTSATNTSQDVKKKLPPHTRK